MSVHSKRITNDGHLLNSENSKFGATKITGDMSSDSLMVDSNIHENPSKFINTQELRLFVGTWNVGGRGPTGETRDSMHDWLMGGRDREHERADIYVIGFQEIVPLNARNILGKHIMTDGSDAALLASIKWEALISSTLNKTSSDKHTNSIYLDNDNNIQTANLVNIPTMTQIWRDDANDKNEDNAALLHDLHNYGDSYAKAHQYDGGCGAAGNVKSQYKYDGDDEINAKSHDQYDCDNTTNLLDQYSGNDNSSGDDNSYPSHVKIDQQNSQNFQYMEHYSFASVTHVPHSFAEQSIPTPSSSTYGCRIYTPPRSTRGIVPFAEIEPDDLNCDASADTCMYTGIARKHMVGLFISVWVRRNLQHHVKAVKVSSVGCGIMNRLGNKGSVSVSLSMHDTSFCFICTHLRSGDKLDDVSRRNVDVSNILRRTRFYCSEKSRSNPSHSLPNTILAHDRIIWLGDLNYRLTLSPNELQDFLIRKDWKALIGTDEVGKKEQFALLQPTNIGSTQTLIPWWMQKKAPRGALLHGYSGATRPRTITDKRDHQSTAVAQNSLNLQYTNMQPHEEENTFMMPRSSTIPRGSPTPTMRHAGSRPNR